MKIQLNKSSVQYLKRAIESAKDILYGVPEFSPERGVKVRVNTDGKVLVHAGSKNILPEGSYELKGMAYKYVTISDGNENYKVEADSFLSIEVEKDE